MSEKLVRLWDKDFNLITSGKSLDEVIGQLRITEDEGGRRWSGRLASADLVDDYDYVGKILAWPVEGQQ